MTGLLLPNADVRILNSPGPVSDAFLRSRAFLQILIGPVGSAKTVTGLRKLRRIGQQQGGRRDAEPLGVMPFDDGEGEDDG